MTKNLFAMVFAVFVLSGAMGDTWTDPDTGYTWTYRIYEDEAEITCTYNNQAYNLDVYVPTINPNIVGEVRIPSAIRGKPVTKIGEHSFFRCTGITHVVVPAGVTGIGYMAFAGCTGIVRVDLPNSLTDIGNGAFGACSNLREVMIPSNVESIGGGAFGNCSSITNVTIPSGVMCIESGTFASCSSLRSVSMPGGITNIGEQAFINCYELRDFSMPDKLISVGDAAFMYCTNIAHMTMPNGLATIGKSAFYGCRGLVDIIIPSSVIKIGDDAFFNCRPLTVEVPQCACDKGLEFTFRYMWPYSGLSIENVVVAEGVTNIGANVFSQCKNLRSVVIPSSVESIDETAFAGCSRIKSVRTPQYVCNRKLSAIFPSSYYTISSITIADEVLNIGDSAFAGCSGLPSVIVPESVTNIEQGAFSGCSVLTNIIFIGDAPDVEGNVFDGVNAKVTVNPWRNGWDLSFSARWNGLPMEYSTPVIFFDANGGNNIDAVIITENGSVTNSFPVAERVGHSFAGWWTQPIGGEVIAVTSFFEKSCAAFAQWTLNKYTVTFDASEGTGGVTNKQEYTSAIVPPVVMREGYTFAGWMPALSETVPPSNVTYAAQWRINQYEVVFDGNGGALGENALPRIVASQDYGSTIVAPTVTKEGHTFVGWSPGVAVTVPASNVTYAAQWQINQYEVAFDANGGDGSVTNEQDYASEIVPPEVSRTGYTFVGWSPEVDAAVPASNVTYTAQWRINADWIEIGVAARYATEVDGTFGTIGTDGTRVFDIGACVESLSTPKITVKGLPTGLKFDSKTGVVSGKATKPGVYKVTVSATNATVKKPVTATFDIVVPNLRSEVLPGLRAETDAYGIVLCGVNLDAGLIDCTLEDGWTLKVAGLPAGLRFDAKTGKITGVPTKAGTFTVTFTATKGKEKETATITLATEALPDWAAGAFTGYVKENGETTVFGPAAMTVAANGKISGKFTLSGTNWTFAAASYAAADGEGFLVEAVAKAGKATMPVELVVCPGFSPETGGTELVNASAEGGFGGSDDAYVHLWRNMWKDKATSAAAKAVLAGWEGVYTLSAEDGGYLSIMVGKNGDVKAAGKLADGTSVSATAPFMYHLCNDFFTVFALSPSAYKGGFVYLPVGFGTERGRLDGLGDGLVWSSRNPQATDAYGEGFERWTSFVGAYYDKARKLSDYYEALRFATEAPTLYYTFKETYLGDNNRKTTESYIADAYAADTLWQEGTTVSVNEKGAPVVAKVTKPVQDRETKEWYYDGANDGALALSFAQATGIFKGSYTFWYDYESAYDDTTGKTTMAHVSKKVSFKGVLVQGMELMRGFYLWDTTGEYVDEKTGKPKTYKYKQSFPVLLRSE